MKGMLKMKAVRRILTLASVCLVVGVCVAYYNTSSLGYDNANIISFNNEEINILDFNIKYEDVKEKIDIMKKHTPSESITI